ncbi:hypothetical protein FRB98_007192 [Tulasnella sp. 332]|nr:hypothetical protein FRB98_007192 [Tulasnella sp. 332]
MGTYADEWNRTYGGPRATGPTVIIVDGIHEENAEVEEKMDLDDDSPIDVSFAVDRIQSQRNNWNLHEYGTEWQLAMDIEIEIDYYIGSTTAILDTNILVSCLHLIQQLVHEQMQQNKHEILLVVPGIVIQELDGLRAKEGVSTSARRANDWLLPRVNRLPCLLGQKTSESPRGNWMYNREGLHNDDLVLECAEFYMRSHGLDQDRVKLITCDKNLQLKAEIEGYGTVAPGPVWHVSEFLVHLRHGSQSTPRIPPAKGQSPSTPTKTQARPQFSSCSSHLCAKDDCIPWEDHAPICSNLAPCTPISIAKKRGRKIKLPNTAVEPTVAKIVCDPDLIILSPHPLNQLHDQLRAYLTQQLPALLLEGIQQVRRQQQLQAEQDKKISIHARPKRPTPIALPKEEEWQGWSVEESLIWIDNAVPAAKNQSIADASTQKLAHFITPYGERGGRKGESWGRGDWDSAANAIDRLFGDAVASDFRTAVEQAFSSGPHR